MNDMKASGLPGSAGGPDLTQRFALDVQGFDRLRQTARDDPHAAAKTVAKEINASFLQMMLKSMRDATPSDGIMDSQDGKTYTSMLDGQLTQELSSKGVGLADSLLKQLGGATHAKDATGGKLAGLGGAAGAGALAGKPLTHDAGHAEKSSGAAAGTVAGAAKAERSERGSSALASGAGEGLAAALHGGPRGIQQGIASLSVQENSHVIAAAATGTMHDRAKLSMDERVAAIEAAAVAAGWRPAQPESMNTAMSARLQVASMGVSKTQAIGNVNARSAATAPDGAENAGNDELDAARPFSEAEVSSIRVKNGSAHVNAFIEKLAPAAEAASRETGIPSHFILSQVALESGWGKSEIRTPSGERTHNVLGVKAGDNWTGPTVTATTTEYIHGRPHRLHEKFRVYGSYQEALQDYANVLKSNSRFQPALRASNTASGFAHGMQKAGYATDPNYASKLLAIIKQMV